MSRVLRASNSSIDQVSFNGLKKSPRRTAFKNIFQHCSARSENNLQAYSKRTKPFRLPSLEPNGKVSTTHCWQDKISASIIWYAFFRLSRLVSLLFRQKWVIYPCYLLAGWLTAMVPKHKDNRNASPLASSAVHHHRCTKRLGWGKVPRREKLIFSFLPLGASLSE